MPWQHVTQVFGQAALKMWSYSDYLSVKYIKLIAKTNNFVFYKSYLDSWNMSVLIRILYNLNALFRIYRKNYAETGIFQ